MHIPYHTEAPEKVREVPPAAPVKGHRGELFREILMMVLYLGLLALLVWGCFHVFRNPTDHYPYHTIERVTVQEPSADSQDDSQTTPQTIMQPVTLLAPHTGATGSDVAGADTIVARFEAHELTTQTFMYYYWDCFFSLYEAYGDSLYSYLNMTVPFDQQMVDDTMSWHAYLSSMAIQTWQQTMLLCDEAEANSFSLGEDGETYLANAATTLATYAEDSGYATTDEYLQNLFDPSSDLESYQAYNRDTLMANTYANSRYTAIYDEVYDPDAPITYCINVRHLLITAEDATSADSMAAAKTRAEELYAQWQQDPTEDNFSNMAGTYTQDPGSQGTGGLYEDVYPGQMVANFNDWCFDESRQPGDHGIVETEYGYHIMYFVGDSETVYEDGNDAAAQEAYITWLDGVFAGYELEDLTDRAVFTAKPEKAETAE